MSYVTTLPEALTVAAGKLQGLGSAMAAENAAAAALTTGVIPAAADPVSVLQAIQFATYGTWYQQVSAHAQAIHEMFVNTLGNSAGSYGAAEATNATATASPLSGFSGLAGGLTGSSTSSDPGLVSNIANLLNIQAGNWGSAASDLIGMAGGGLLTAIPVETTEGAGADLGGLAVGLEGATLTSVPGPAGSGLGGAPVSASLGQASAVGGLSVPPSWAGEGMPASPTSPATLAGAGWTTAPAGTPVTTVPTGMPAMASAGKSPGFGAPRYGVKPTVMPKPEVV